MTSKGKGTFSLGLLFRLLKLAYMTLWFSGGKPWECKCTSDWIQELGSPG